MTGPDLGRRWRRLQRQLPLVGVWLVAVAAAVGLWIRQDPGHVAVGFADGTDRRLQLRIEDLALYLRVQLAPADGAEDATVSR